MAFGIIISLVLHRRIKCVFHQNLSTCEQQSSFFQMSLCPQYDGLVLLHFWKYFGYVLELDVSHHC